MTPAELDEIEQLLKKATPGPWEVETYSSGQANVTMPRGRSLHFPPFATVYGNAGIATTIGDGAIIGESGHELDGLTEAEYDQQRYHDAKVIATLRNHAPALLAAARRGARIEAEARRLLFALSRGNQTAAESFVEIADLRAALAKETL